MVSASCNIKFVMKGLGIHPKMDVFMGGKKTTKPNQNHKQKTQLVSQKSTLCI